MCQPAVISQRHCTSTLLELRSVRLISETHKRLDYPTLFSMKDISQYVIYSNNNWRLIDSGVHLPALSYAALLQMIFFAKRLGCNANAVDPRGI